MEGFRSDHEFDPGASLAGDGQTRGKKPVDRRSGIKPFKRTVVKRCAALRGSLLVGQLDGR